MKHAKCIPLFATPSFRYQERGSNRRRGQGMELVPSRRSPPNNSMLAGLAATMKGKAASMQEDAKGKVSRSVFVMGPKKDPSILDRGEGILPLERSMCRLDFVSDGTTNSSAAHRPQRGTYVSLPSFGATSPHGKEDTRTTIC